MSIRVNREEFLNRLDSVQAGLAAKEIVEQSDCLVFADGMVSTFNDEVFCQRESLLGSKLRGAVKAKKLLNMLRKLPEEEIDIDMTDFAMVLIGKNRRTEIRMDKEIISHAGAVEVPTEWQTLDPEFGEAIGVVQQCAGNNQSEFQTTCVHVHPDYVEACDGVQLCRWKLKTKVSQPTLVKKYAIKHVGHLGMTKIAETDSWLHFKNGSDLILSCRRYVEDFLDLTPILEVEGTPIELPKGLIDATDRAQEFSEDNESNQNLVKVELKPGKIRVIGEGLDGKHTEKRKLRYDGPPLAFMIAPKLLMQIVEKHNECLVSKDKLKVNAGKYEYASCLADPNQRDEEEPNGDEE